MSTTVKKKKTASPKVHMVLGDRLAKQFDARLKKLGMTRSEAGRVMVQAFVDGDIDISPPAAKGKAG